MRQLTCNNTATVVTIVPVWYLTAYQAQQKFSPLEQSK